jgi:hypothetical protein
MLEHAPLSFATSVLSSQLLYGLLLVGRSFVLLCIEFESMMGEVFTTLGIRFQHLPSYFCSRQPIIFVVTDLV